MLAFIVAIDTNIYPHVVPLCIEIMKWSPTANIFLIEHQGKNHFSNGALLNVGLQLAGLAPVTGLTPMYRICFCSFDVNTWIMSPSVTFKQFVTSNGYNNYEQRATVIDPYCPHSGYEEIFAQSFYNRKYGKRLYHYVVEIQKDTFLNVNTIPNTILNI